MASDPIVHDASGPATRTTLADHARELLRERILWGDIPPGAPLRETELAEQLQISRTPLRQALHRLEADGLAVRQGARLSVAPFDLDAAVETLIIRELLEPFAASESAPRLTPPETARLQSILREMEAVLEHDAPDPRHGAELNMELHRLLNSRCPYPRVVETIQVARDAHSALRLYSTYQRDDLVRVHAEHVEIVATACRVAEDGPADAQHLGHLIARHMGLARTALLRNIAPPGTGENPR